MISDILSSKHYLETNLILIMMIFLTLVIACTILTYIYVKKSLSYWKIRNIPGPTPLLFFGNLKKSALRQVSVVDVYKEIYDKYPNSKVVGIFTMTEPALLIRDLEIIKQILVKDFENFPERGVEFSKEGLGENLVHCNKETWKLLKTTMSSFFTTKKMIEIVPVMLNEGEKLVEYVSNKIKDNPEQEIHNLFRKFTMSLTMAAFFDIGIDTFTNNQFFSELDQSIFGLKYYHELLILMPDIMKSYKMSIFGKTAIKFSHKIIETIERNNTFDQNNKYINQLLTLGNQRKTESFNRQETDEIISHKDKESLKAAQAFVLFAAGYENTANNLSFALYNLAKNVDIQEKVVKEVDDVSSRFGNEITSDVLSQMFYLEKVFKETLRINPVTAVLQRKALKDYTIPDTDIKIEKGMSVLISPITIHRDRKYYPDPERFDPERFSVENLRQRHSYAYLPFGAGPRSCIGIRFSSILFKVTLFKIFSKFTVQVTEKTSKEEFDPYRLVIAMKGGKIMAQIQFGVALVKILSKFTVTPSKKTMQIENYDPMRNLITTKGGIYINLIPRHKPYSK